MRSKMIIVATVVASLLFVPLMASADQVQEQLRLMEQRMAEMEDRLQATSVELQSAKATVDQQQGLLTDAGLIDADDLGIRSGVSDFLNMVEVDGVMAASYNHRLKRSKVATTNNSGTIRDSSGIGGNDLYRHPDSNTFAVDQLWLNVGKTPTEESRGGFHFAFVTGKTADALSGGNNDDFQPYLYDAYVSYLFDCACGFQLDAGLMPTVFGAEAVQTDLNFFVTQGELFRLQPITNTGVKVSGKITDEVSYQVGILNEIYDATMTSMTADKAYFLRVAADMEKMSFGAGVIHGSDQTSVECQGADCHTTIIDLVMSADPTDNVSVWANFDYVIAGGEDMNRTGHAYGVSVAGRLAVTEKTGVASRVEWVMRDAHFVGNSTNDDTEIVTLTGTVDHALSDHVTARMEFRWDTFTQKDASQFAGDNNDQVTGFAEILYKF